MNTTEQISGVGRWNVSASTWSVPVSIWTLLVFAESWLHHRSELKFSFGFVFQIGTFTVITPLGEKHTGDKPSTRPASSYPRVAAVRPDGGGEQRGEIKPMVCCQKVQKVTPSASRTRSCSRCLAVSIARKNKKKTSTLHKRTKKVL